MGANQAMRSMPQAAAGQQPTQPAPAVSGFTPRPTPWPGWSKPTGTDPRLNSPMGLFMQQHPGMGYYNAAGSMNPADWSYAKTTPGPQPQLGGGLQPNLPRSPLYRGGHSPFFGGF